MCIISKINKTFIDESGKLHECINIGFDLSDVPPGWHLYPFSINPNQTRGNHFHKVKKEWFMCLSGEVELILKEEKTKNSSVSITQTVWIPLSLSPVSQHPFL